MGVDLTPETQMPCPACGVTCQVGVRTGGQLVINCPEHGVVLISQTEESGVQRPANLVLSPLQGGILQAQPHADDLHALGVQTWPQAVLKWVASDARVSCVLTATHLREHAIENAEAGMPPWFDADQRAIVERVARGG